jgi:hypothetical protein
LKVCFLEFDEIVNRLFTSGWDQEVHRTIIVQTQLKAFELKAQKKEYERAKNRQEKALMLRAASEELQSRRFPKYENHYWYEILAQNVYNVLNRKWRNHVFGHRDRESELYPVALWKLGQENHRVYRTFNRMREKWPDLYAAKHGRLGYGVNTASVDAKVSYSEFKRYLEQCTGFARYSNKVYVAVTPGLIADIGNRRAESIAHGEKEFRRMLEDVGSGAYVIDMTIRDIIAKIDASDSEDLDKQEQEQRLRILGYK